VVGWGWGWVQRAHDGAVNAVAWHVTRGFSPASASRLLLTAGDGYSCLKLWARTDQSSEFSGARYECVSSVTLAPGPLNAVFYQLNLDVTGSWAVVSYKHSESSDDHSKQVFDNGFYALHVRRPTGPRTAATGANNNELDAKRCRFDYVAPFPSGQPIVSFWLAIGQWRCAAGGTEGDGKGKGKEYLWFG
jgi:hypothetical protein